MKMPKIKPWWCTCRAAADAPRDEHEPDCLGQEEAWPLLISAFPKPGKAQDSRPEQAE